LPVLTLRATLSKEKLFSSSRCEKMLTIHSHSLQNQYLWTYSKSYATRTPNSNKCRSQQNEIKRKKNLCNTAPYSDSLLSSLSSHKGADWIITRAPEGSLQFWNSLFCQYPETKPIDGHMRTVRGNSTFFDLDHVLILVEWLYSHRRWFTQWWISHPIACTLWWTQWRGSSAIFLLTRAVSHIRGRGEYCSRSRLLTWYDSDSLGKTPETTWLARAFCITFGMCCSINSEKCSKEALGQKSVHPALPTKSANF